MSSKAANPYAGLIAAIAYSVVSITITLSNKFVLSTSDGAKFDSAQTLTVLQGLVTVVCLHFMKMFKYIDYPSLDWSMARRVAPLSFVFISYVVISLVSLGRVNIPMFTALRRVTIVFVMIEVRGGGVRGGGRRRQEVIPLTPTPPLSPNSPGVLSPRHPAGPHGGQLGGGHVRGRGHRRVERPHV